MLCLSGCLRWSTDCGWRKEQGWSYSTVNDWHSTSYGPRAKRAHGSGMNYRSLQHQLTRPGRGKCALIANAAFHNASGTLKSAKATGGSYRLSGGSVAVLSQCVCVVVLFSAVMEKPINKEFPSYLLWLSSCFG